MRCGIWCSGASEAGASGDPSHPRWRIPLVTTTRHRAGALLAAGCDFTLLSSARARLLLGPEVSFLLLGYSVGPSLYGHVGINLGGSFRLL